MTTDRKPAETAIIKTVLDAAPDVFPTPESAQPFVETFLEYQAIAREQGYQRGLREGIEKTIKLMDQIGCDWRDAGDMTKFYATNYLVEQVRALSPKEE